MGRPISALNKGRTTYDIVVALTTPVITTHEPPRTELETQNLS